MIEYTLIYVICTILTYLVLDKTRVELGYTEGLVRFFAVAWPITWMLAIGGFIIGIFMAIRRAFKK